MKTQKEVTANIIGTKNKLEKHEANYDKFGWRKDGGQNLLRAEKTKTYMIGWINALKWVLDE